MEGNNCDQDQFDRNISNKTENSSSGIVQSREGGHHHHLGGQTTPVEVTVSQHVDQGGQAEAKSGESEDEKKEEEEKKESFNFPCSDIRYRLMKKETETALSLFIFSPLNNNVKNLMNKIDNIKRRSKHEQVGDNNNIVRIDYVFKNEKDQKTFHDKIVDLPKPQDLILVSESVPEELLLHGGPPTLREEELLLICSDSLAENSFQGFSVNLLETNGALSFEFESMSAVNVFLTDNIGYKDAFLGGLRKRPSSSLSLLYIKKYGKVSYPLQVKLDECYDLNHLQDMSKKYKFKVFTKNNGIPKKYATIDFKEKRDLYFFVTKENVKFHLNIKF